MRDVVIPPLAQQLMEIWESDDNQTKPKKADQDEPSEENSPNETGEND